MIHSNNTSETLLKANGATGVKALQLDFKRRAAMLTVWFSTRNVGNYKQYRVGSTGCAALARFGLPAFRLLLVRFQISRQNNNVRQVSVKVLK